MLSLPFWDFFSFQPKYLYATWVSYSHLSTEIATRYNCRVVWNDKFPSFSRLRTFFFLIMAQGGYSYIHQETAKLPKYLHTRIISVNYLSQAWAGFLSLFDISCGSWGNTGTVSETGRRHLVDIHSQPFSSIHKFTVTHRYIQWNTFNSCSLNSD